VITILLVSFKWILAWEGIALYMYIEEEGIDEMVIF